MSQPLDLRANGPYKTKETSDQLTPNLFANKSAAIIGFFSLAWHSPRLLRWVAAYMCGRGFAPRMSKPPLSYAYLFTYLLYPQRLLLPLKSGHRERLYHFQSCLFRHRTFSSAVQDISAHCLLVIKPPNV